MCGDFTWRCVSDFEELVGVTHRVTHFGKTFSQEKKRRPQIVLNHDEVRLPALVLPTSPPLTFEHSEAHSLIPL